MYKKAFIAAMEDGTFLSTVKEQVREVVETAVATAVAARDAEIKELRDELTDTRAEVRELKDELTDTKAKVNEIEQYSRRMCLNISGIPENSNESTDQLVKDVAKMVGVTVTPEDIDRTHRVGIKKQDQHRTIITRLTTFAKRQELYDARRKLRTPKAFPGSSVTAATAESAFISDNLTRENQLTLFKARQLRRDRKIFAAWSDVGKVKVRVREGGSTVIIRSERDLETLLAPAASGPAPSASASAAQIDSDGFRRVTRRRAGGKT